VPALIYIMSARMTDIEQYQAVLERHMAVFRDAQIDIQPLRSYPDQ
jgi:hypothetical protein